MSTKTSVNRTWLDRAIGAFSPSAELNRLKARAAISMLSRAYEGASKGRRTANWNTGGADANAALAGGIATLRSRSRDLVRNNPWATKAVGVLEGNVVGEGIIPQTRAESKRLAETYEKLWIDWGDEVACHSEERLDFYGIQALAMRSIAESGSVLIRRRWRKASDNLAVPMQLQVLEPDYLDTTRDTLYGANGGNLIINGIEYDRRGKRVAYWLYPEHPGSNRTYMSLQSVRVMASDIIHIYRMDRPGQVDGVPWAASAIIRIRDLDEFEDANLIRQKIAACFVGFIHDIEALEDMSGDSTKREIAEKVEPGMLEVLPPGKSITFGSPPAVIGYREHTQVSLQSIAAGYQVTYESLTGDYSNVNFSSGRMGWLEFNRKVKQWQHHMLIPHLCKGVWRWFGEAAIVSGAVSEMAKATWTTPRREMIDPVKETTAVKEQIRSGLRTLSEALREQGYDPAAVFAERAQDDKMLDEMGIAVDSDPRKD